MDSFPPSLNVYSLQPLRRLMGCHQNLQSGDIFFPTLSVSLSLFLSLPFPYLSTAHLLLNKTHAIDFSTWFTS